jgi:hypothetical protein
MDYENQGIWRLDTSTDTFTRLRPFAHGLQTPEPGLASYLTDLGDRLLFESWPAFLEMDLATIRDVRRYPSLFGPGARWWVFRGRFLIPEVAGMMGLAPGAYGHVQCGVSDIYWPGLWCEDPYPFQGGLQTMGVASWGRLFRRPESPDDSVVSLIEDFSILNPPQYVPALVTDPSLRGFWTGNGLAFGFVPVVGGRIALESATTIPADPDVAAPGTWLIARLARDPAGDGFLAVLSWNGYPNHKQFIALDSGFHLRRIVSERGGGFDDPMPLTLATFPNILPNEYEQAIPVIARTAGLNDTFWSSELWLYNPSAEPTTLRVRRVTHPEEVRTVDLPARGSFHVGDAVTWIGGGPGGDGTIHETLVLTSPYRWGEQLVAVSRSSTPSSDPVERVAGGTAGHAVTAVPTRLGYTNHLDELGPVIEHRVGRSSQLVLDRVAPGRFRHNVGIVNDAGTPLTMSFTLGPFGFEVFYEVPPPGHTFSITVPPHRVQVTNLDALLPAGPLATYPASLSVVGDRPAIVFLSMVDNLTGDATFVPYSLLWMMTDETTRHALPAVAHLPGAGGTVWRTDLYGAWMDYVNGVEDPPFDTDEPRAYFHPAWPATSCGGAVAGGGEVTGNLIGQLSMPPEQWGQSAVDWHTVFPDVAHGLAPCANDPNLRGALELRAGSWLAGYARTYTVRADGGTYGEMLPLYPNRGWPVQHFAGIEVGPRFRVNLGLFNGDKDHAITHRLTLYDAAGTKVAEAERVLQPWENLVDRLERLLHVPLDSLPAGTYGLTVLPLDDPTHGVEGRSWAFVSLVDNVTGDPTNWW